ncbi:MAG: SusC/RagA family TonB-linked outer membrane protein, partial [Bacteroidetes bacterium]|nr:SusC/RagA family TonB-linked outer membrane protein [Bacteroidota bacterium]
IEEGYPLFYLRGYKVGGIFQTQEELDAWKAVYNDVSYQTAKVAPGDLYFNDVRSAPKNPDEFYSNIPDSVINSYDQVYLGKSIPGFFYGLNFNIEYKNFDLGAQFTGVGDVVKYNDLRAAMEYTPGTGNNLSTSIYDSWTPNNTSTSMPRVIGGDPAQNFRRSDRFVENASYFRLSNIQIGFTLPASFYDFTRKSISNLRIYAGSSNLFTITKYSGFDPESDKYPTPRVFFMGLNVRF